MSQSSSDSPSRFWTRSARAVVVAEVFAQDKADLRVFRDRLPEHLRDVLAQVDAEVEEVGEDDDLLSPPGGRMFQTPRRRGSPGRPSGRVSTIPPPDERRASAIRSMSSSAPAARLPWPMRITARLLFPCDLHSTRSCVIFPHSPEHISNFAVGLRGRFRRSRDLFSTMHILAALPGRQLAPEGAQTCVPADVPLRWHGARKNLQSRPPEIDPLACGTCVQ